MQIGIAGLGKMGMNMARRLIKGKHKVVAYNRSAPKVKQIKKEGAAAGTTSLSNLVDALKTPRVIWLMLPSGDVTENAIKTLKPLLKKGDTIIDGGNSFYKDAIRRHSELAAIGINFADVGVSGGIWGLQRGYCLMMGGEKRIYKKLLPALKSLAIKNGYLHCGDTGSGHFVKMVHNGIEYGMMSAYGEGFDIMQASPFAEELDFKKISNLWNQGSVIQSWLLELCESAFSKDADLSDIEHHVSDSGEGRWTVEQAVESAVPAPVITAALFQRFRSRGNGEFSDKILAALRAEFGGHAVVKSKGKKK
jgi:6-phosphogluconate dehydrogenase